jgi:hypothetical protein
VLVGVEVILGEAVSVCAHRPAGASTPPTSHWSCPLRRKDAEFALDALAEMYAVTGGYPYFIQAYGKEVWDLAPGTPITREDVLVAVPRAEAELAVGFFGSRYERATPAERDYLRAMAEVAVVDADGNPVRMGSATEPESELGGGSGAELDSVPTSEVAKWLGKQPQSLSPARDALLKKGLIYSTERGRIAFTVPHFGRYLRDHP